MSETQSSSPAGLVPVPSGVSPEAQKYLADVNPFGDGSSPNYSADAEEWISWVESRDRAILERLGSALPAGSIGANRE